MPICRIFPIKGKGGAGIPNISKPTKNNKQNTPLFTIGVDTGKSLLYERLKVEAPGPGYCHFPTEPEKGYDDTYFKGLTSEKQIIKYKDGKTFFAWVLKDSTYKRNEPWDLRNYATAALEIATPVLKKPESDKTKGRRQRQRGINAGG